MTSCWWAEKPSVEFLSRIKQAGFPLPEFVEVPGGDAVGGGNRVTDEAVLGSRAALPILATRKLGSLRPWGWGPDSFELLKPLFASVTGETRADEKRFNPGLARLYAKSWSAEFLRNILASRDNLSDEPQIPHPRAEIGNLKLSQSLLTSAATKEWLCTENEIGVTVNSLSAARAAVAAIRARGHHNVVVKQAFGAAGSQALRLLEPEVLAAQWRWMETACARKQELVVEPWLDRVQDFSVQLEMTAAGLKRCGFTGLLTDARGQFVANFAESHHHTRLPAQVVAQFREPPDISRRLLEFYEELLARLETELRAVDFLGPVGMDAFVYRDAHGAVRLKPVVEMNPRYTMGRVLVELMRQTRQNCAGSLRLVNAAQLRAEGFEDFPGYARALEEKFPLRFEGEPAPRIREGALCLNDPTTAQTCLAIFRVSRRLDELLAPGAPASAC
jgi:hypothetical protein